MSDVRRIDNCPAWSLRSDAPTASRWSNTSARPVRIGRARRPGRQRAKRGASVQRPPGDRRELARQAVGHLASHRQLALALELLDGGPGLGAEHARGLDLAVAEIP